VVLRGTPLEDGGVSMQDGAVTYGTRSAVSAYRGSIVSLSGRSIVADVTSASGGTIRLDIHVLDDGSGGASGTISGASANG
jgi:hypothetical protein